MNTSKNMFKKGKKGSDPLRRLLASVMKNSHILKYKSNQEVKVVTKTADFISENSLESAVESDEASANHSLDNVSVDIDDFEFNFIDELESSDTETSELDSIGLNDFEESENIDITDDSNSDFYSFDFYYKENIPSEDAIYEESFTVMPVINPNQTIMKSYFEKEKEIADLKSIVKEDWFRKEYKMKEDLSDILKIERFDDF